MKIEVAGMSILLIAAFILALIAAAMPELLGVDMLLVIGLLVGLAIGFLNITKGESLKFMVAYLAIVASAGFLATLPSVGEFLQAFFSQLFVVFGIATFLVAFKVIYNTLKK